MNSSKLEKVTDLRGYLLIVVVNVIQHRSDTHKSTIYIFESALDLIKETQNLNQEFFRSWEKYKKALTALHALSVTNYDTNLGVKVLRKIANCMPRDETMNDEIGCQEFWFLYEMVTVEVNLMLKRRITTRASLMKCKEMLQKTQPGTALHETFKIANYFIFYKYFTDKIVKELTPTKDHAFENGVKYLKYSFESGVFRPLNWIEDMLEISELCIETQRLRQSHYLIRVGKVVLQNAIEKQSEFLTYRATDQFEIAFLLHILAVLRFVYEYAQKSIAEIGEFEIADVEEEIEIDDECILIEGVEVQADDEMLDRILRSKEEVQEVYKLAREQVTKVRDLYIIKNANTQLDIVKEIFKFEF